MGEMPGVRGQESNFTQRGPSAPFYVLRFTFYALPTTHHVTRHLDTLIGLLLFLAGLYAYTRTLAPTVLDGDAALFQYTPYVLGVTYPTGYPLYILLGKLWLTLFPWGEIAWRMNLFSALCSAAALPLIYHAARYLFDRRPMTTDHRLLATNPTPYSLLPLAAVLTFATLPTFWRWSTETKIYALNILLFSGVLYTMARVYVRCQAARGPSALSGVTPHLSHSSLPAPRFPLLALPALLLGLQLTVHSTTVLLVPGLLLFAWLNLRPALLNKKSLISYLLFLSLPLLLYLYIPLRAEWLIAQHGYTGAVQRGLLADFYHSGLTGLIRYFTAADFTGGVVRNWGLVPQQFVTVYLAQLLKNDLTLTGMILGAVGGMGLAFTRPRLFWPLLLLYALPIPFVLTYGQGEQSAFLLPSFLIFSIFVGNSLTLMDSAKQRMANKLKLIRPFAHLLIRSFAPLLFLALIPLLFLPQIRYNLNWLNAKWDRAAYNYWADALAHPLPQGATLLAQWGDLTSFWYMQYAENRRPDVRGLYPPTEASVSDALAQGDSLFMAGPASKEWANSLITNYQLLPWGRLVRIAPKTVDPHTLLPTLPNPSQAIFDNQLRLLSFDYPPTAVDGQTYGVTLAWQALADLPPETTLSLRLSQGDVIAAQLDDSLLSGWFPRQRLSARQYLLSYAPIPIPPGTLPGLYRLQLVVYVSYKHPWPLADGATLLDLGEVELTLPPDRPEVAAPLHPAAGYNFNGEIRLADYEYTVTRVGQGKGFGVKLLWQAETRPAADYTLLAELVDRQGQVLRSVQSRPVGGRAPTAAWQPGQLVRDQVDLVLPASAPVGEQAVRVRLSWLQANGAKAPLRRWGLPSGDSLNLDWLAVTEEERTFSVPPIAHPLEANLDNKAKLLGYNTSLPPVSGPKAEFQWSRSACAARPEACHIHFDFIWQGVSEMDAVYSVFLHLVDGQGNPLAQQDKGPGIRGKEPTTTWLPGEVITDPVDLTLSPDQLPPGRYTLRIGMYLPPDGPRLPLVDGGGQNFVEIGTVEVTP